VDDNLAAAVVEGVQQEGVRMPEDLEIVAHANFPLENRLPLPVWRLGLDNRNVLLTAIAILQQQQRGEAPPAITHQPWVFEAELPNGRSDGRK
jgi:DNA-binding LacI/PurR family transcriptional regulator